MPKTLTTLYSSTRQYRKMMPQATTTKTGQQRNFINDSPSNYPQSIQLAKLVICGAPLWLNQPDSLTSKSCFGQAFLHLQISSTVKLEEGSKDWMHHFSNLNTNSSHVISNFIMTTSPVATIENPSTISKPKILGIRIRSGSTNSTLKCKHSPRTQFFLIKNFAK